MLVGKRLFCGWTCKRLVSIVINNCGWKSVVIVFDIVTSDESWIYVYELETKQQLIV